MGDQGGFDEMLVQELAEAEGFRQVERRDASVKYNHGERDGGCSIEVYLDHRSVKITLKNATEGRYDSTILKKVKTSQLLMLFRKPAARLVYRQPNPFYVHHNFHHSESRRFFRSVYAPIDGTLESISLGYHPSTYFILYKDGSFAHSEGIPPPLHRRLLGRQEWLPRPELVRLGKASEKAFFILYADGTADWGKLPRELESVLLNSTSAVEELALGEGKDYYVRLRNGHETWCVVEPLALILEKGRSADKSGEVKRIALGRHGDFYVQFGDGRKEGRMHRSARIALASFESSSDVAIDLGAEDEYVVVGRRRHLNNNIPGNNNASVAKRRHKEGTEGEKDKRQREDLDEMVEMGRDSCSCQRDPGLVVCRDCGEVTPGRLRRVCQQHPLAVHSTDIFACRGCGQSKADLLEEHPGLPGMPGASKKNVKIIG